MSIPLPQSFFLRETKVVAREMLGAHIVCKKRSGKTVGKIVEVEVYDGFSDKASHASRGKTKRNAPMFGPGGHFYVYLCYGVHEMLNIVTREKGYPAAILVRGVEINGERVSGPGRVTKALGVDRRLNGERCGGVPSHLSPHRFCDTKKRENLQKLKHQQSGSLSNKEAKSYGKRCGGVGTGLWIEKEGDIIKENDIKKAPRIGVAYAGPVWSKRKLRFYIDL